MAKAYSCRPSQLLDIQDPYDAYRIDRSVWTFGSELTAQLSKVEGKNDQEVRRKQDRILQRWIPEVAQAAKKQFRDPPSTRGVQLP